jgi:hypothetical protein
MNTLKVNITKLANQLQTESPFINDLIYTGVSQFLGTTQGPIELHIPGSGIIFSPSAAMVKFLQEMEILIPETVEEKESLLHS